MVTGGRGQLAVIGGRHVNAHWLCLCHWLGHLLDGVISGVAHEDHALHALTQGVEAALTPRGARAGLVTPGSRHQLVIVSPLGRHVQVIVASSDLWRGRRLTGGGPLASFLRLEAGDTRQHVSTVLIKRQRGHKLEVGVVSVGSVWRDWGGGLGLASFVDLGVEGVLGRGRVRGREATCLLRTRAARLGARGLGEAAAGIDLAHVHHGHAALASQPHPGYPQLLLSLGCPPHIRCLVTDTDPGEHLALWLQSLMVRG